MDRFDRRKYPRRRVNLSAAVVVHLKPAPVTAVIDLSEGGAGLEWQLPGDVELGAPVRLRFLLAGGQNIEIEGRVVRIAGDRAGVEFLPEQETQVRQLLTEARSAD